MPGRRGLWQSWLMTPSLRNSDRGEPGNRGRASLRRLFRVDPPKSLGEGVWRLFVALIVMIPLSIAAALLFDLLGWSSLFGVIIAVVVGSAIVSRLYDSRGT